MKIECQETHQTDNLAIIERINDAIAHRVGKQRFKIWFNNSTRLKIEDHYLKVGVPNLFIGGWIENHFSEQIKDALTEVIGEPMKIIFNIDPELFGAQRRSQLDGQAQFVARSTNPSVELPMKKNGQARMPLRLKIEHFVVGPSNQLAYSAANSIINEPGRQFNPLFIHGSCGLGKTHLLQGICNAIGQQKPHLRYLYVSGEEFTNQFILSLKTGKLDDFRRRYRQVDLLVIDDVHFLASKKATQEEFLHTFNAIDAASKQVVLASDAHPKMIGQLSESLISRFVSGMVVKIDPPVFETRCQILRQRAAQLEKTVPAPVIEYIAENVQANVRELEGALLKIIAYASLNHNPITVSMAREAIEDHISRTDPIVRLSDIESVVTTFFGITPADIHSTRKTRTISLARSLAMYMARKHTTMSFPEIGRFMGGKNHATVILACRKIKQIMDNPHKKVIWDTVGGRREMNIDNIMEKLETSIHR